MTTKDNDVTSMQIKAQFDKQSLDKEIERYKMLLDVDKKNGEQVVSELDSMLAMADDQVEQKKYYKSMEMAKVDELKDKLAETKERIVTLGHIRNELQDKMGGLYRCWEQLQVWEEIEHTFLRQKGMFQRLNTRSMSFVEPSAGKSYNGSPTNGAAEDPPIDYAYRDFVMGEVNKFYQRHKNGPLSLGLRIIAHYTQLSITNTSLTSRHTELLDEVIERRVLLGFYPSLLVEKEEGC